MTPEHKVRDAWSVCLTFMCDEHFVFQGHQNINNTWPETIMYDQSSMRGILRFTWWEHDLNMLDFHQSHTGLKYTCETLVDGVYFVWLWRNAPFCPYCALFCLSFNKVNPTPFIHCTEEASTWPTKHSVYFLKHLQWSLINMSEQEVKLLQRKTFYTTFLFCFDNVKGLVLLLLDTKGHQISLKDLLSCKITAVCLCQHVWV